MINCTQVLKKLRSFIRLSLLCVTLLGVLIMAVILHLNSQLPDVSSVRAYELSVPLRIYSAQKDLIGSFGNKRIPIQYSQIPENFIHAILAAEDSRFVNHHGIDIQSSMRALLQAFGVDNSRQTGASTITMQVARNYFLSNERTIYRKINEILLSLQIERQLNKEEIIELYANKIYLGMGAYGIAAAAKIYYDKKINELNIAQLAMIAGLPKAPSRYNPVVNPARALTRRNWILKRMLALGNINHQQYQESIKQPIVAKDHSIKTDFDARYLAEMVRLELLSNPDFKEGLYSKGYKVYTTLDSKLQASADLSLRDGLFNYDMRQGYRAKRSIYSITYEDGTIATPEQISELLVDEINIAGTAPAIIYNIDDESESLQAVTAGGEIASLDMQAITWIKKQYPANTLLSSIFKLGQLIRVEKIELAESKTVAEEGLHATKWRIKQLPQAQAAIVAVNPQDGAILALSGGFSFDLSQYNRATQAYRQLGSAFKPFIYGAALSRGYTPASIVNDSPIAVDHTNKVWLPENDNLSFYGPIRLRQALYQSRNMVSIRLLRALEVDHMRDFAQKFGFEAQYMPSDLSLSLGTVETTPLQAAIAYAAIANGGYKVTPFFIDYITDNTGEILYEADPLIACQNKCHANTNIAPAVMDAKTNYVLADMLKDVVNKGTARKARALKRKDLAGKTGTTNNQIDAWFNGFNSNIAASVWVGFDQPQSLNEYGSQAALPIWIDFMRDALGNSPYSFLEEPEGIVHAYIDRKTGTLVNKQSKGAIEEIFQNESLLPQQTYFPQSVDEITGESTNAAQGIESLF